MANQPVDAFDLVNNGTARIFVEGEPYPLRRPKVGEFRKLRELLHDAQDKIARKANGDDDEEVEEILASEPEGGEGTDAEQAVEKLVEQANEVRRITRTLNDFAEGLYQDWVEEAVRVLGDKPLPPDRDGWPLFTTSAEFVAKLIEHWRSVPLALGGK